MERFFLRSDPLKMEVRKRENVLVDVNISILWEKSVIMKENGLHNISAIPSLVISNKKSCIFHMKTDQ